MTSKAMYKILVIEDENIILSNIISILKFENLEAIGAQNGAIGIELAKQKSPDLIVCDIMMPGTDGYGVKNALSQDPRTSDIPFIFLTAKTDRSAIRLGMALGADDYLTKPFTRDELLESIYVRLDKQATIQRQLQAERDKIRGYITTSLPSALLVPLYQIQTFLKKTINEEIKIESNFIPEAQEAYNSSLHIERQLQNFILYALLESIQDNSEKVNLLKGSSITKIYDIIHATSLAKARQYDRDLDLKIDLQESEVMILEDNLVKIIEEIIDNSFKFSSIGNIVLVKSKIDSDFVEIDIYNQGAGLTRQQIDELDAYIQFGVKLYGRHGTGLGLSIARSLIQLYSGTLSIESVVGQSTTVTVRLPLAT